MDSTKTSGQELTAADLMKFLQSFQNKMEVNLADNKKSIDDTNRIMNGRLDGIDNEVKKVNTRLDDNELKGAEVNKRMDDRLTALELEMRKSTVLGRKAEDLRNNDAISDLNFRPHGNSAKDTTKKVIGVKTYGKKVDDTTKMILLEPAGTFRSSWARSMEKELRMAAGAVDKLSDRGMNDLNEASEEVVEEPVDIPEHWEERVEEDIVFRSKPIRPVPKIRKPVTEWFGMGTSSEDSEPDIDLEEWSDVDRKRRNQEKKIKAAKRKHTMKQECATRAMNMFSIGPITIDSVEFFRKKGLNFEESKVAAFKEYLRYNLNYGIEELEVLKVAETRLSTKGDAILNVALENIDDVKEVFVRRAESGNDNLVVRCYIPPNFHERFMAINKICMEKRQDEPDLKTQLRFGYKDVEVYTKYRGDNTGFRKVTLSEFTDVTTLPKFNANLKWKRFQDRPPRKSSHWEDLGARPSTAGQTNIDLRRHTKDNTNKEDMTMDTGSPSTGKTSSTNPLIRANSNSTMSTSKKTKTNMYSADSSEEDDEEYLSDSAEQKQKFRTPTGTK